MFQRIMLILLLMRCVSCMAQVTIGAGVTLGSGVVIGSSAAVFPAPPANATEFDLSPLPSTSFTHQAGACCSNDQGTTQATGTDATTFDNASPSLSGSSIMLSTTGESYNGQVFRVVCSSFTSGNCANMTNVWVDVWVYIPSTSSPLQGLEGPDVVFYTGSIQLYPSSQCATNKNSTTPQSQTWNYWNGTAWVPWNVSCSAFITATDMWHHIQAHYQVNLNTAVFTYIEEAVDGVDVYKNPGVSFTGISYTGGLSMKVQQQVDAKNTATQSTYYIDNWKVWVE